MRSSLPYYLVGFILLIGLLIFIGPRLTRGPVPDLVNEIIGPAEIKSEGSSAWRTLQLGAAVKAGDSLRTKAGAAVNILWLGGTHMRMGENSEILIDHTYINNVSRTAGIRIKQTTGRLWVRLIKEPKLITSVEVAADGLIYKAGHSSAFSSECLSEGRNRLEVPYGRCEVIQGQARALIDAPKVAIYDKTGSVEAARPMTEAEDDAWRNNTQITGAFITLLAPQEGEHLTSALLSLSGYTDPGNTIQIVAANQSGAANETPGTVDEIGKWSGKIALKKGETNLRIIALDAEGRQTLMLRKVSY
jgi:hypothetical protein